MNTPPVAPRLLDLSHPLKLGTKGWPGAARLIGWPLKEIGIGDYNVLHISTDLHTGTHLDAMRHCVPDGTDTASLPLEHCVGPAVVVDLRRKSAKGGLFEPEDFRPHEAEIRRHRKVLVKTGWAKTWETPDYHDNFPGFSRPAAEYLVDLGLHLVGVEQASIHPHDHLAVHKIFFGRQTVIVEGLANVEAITAPVVEFFAAPLRLVEADGSLVRAFCRF